MVRSMLKCLGYLLLLFVIVLMALAALLVYVRTYDGGGGVCPDMDKSKIEVHIRDYAHGKFPRADLVFNEEFSYMSDLAQWKVPYYVDGYRYVVKMNCAGYILDDVGPYN